MQLKYNNLKTRKIGIILQLSSLYTIHLLSVDCIHTMIYHCHFVSSSPTSRLFQQIKGYKFKVALTDIIKQILNGTLLIKNEKIIFQSNHKLFMDFRRFLVKIY